MSWNYTSKVKVSALSGIPEGDLEDFYSDWAEALIDKHVGYAMTGTVTYTEEVHSGDGATTLFVDHPPIASVSALSVSDGSYTSSDYKVFDTYIELVGTSSSEDSDAESVFPTGVGNVLISYVGQSATIPKEVELAATQMIATIAMVSQREGSDASLKYSEPSKREGDTRTTLETNGLQSSLINIMNRYLSKKVMCA